MKKNYNPINIWRFILILFLGLISQLDSMTLAQSRIVVPHGTQISDGSTPNSLKPLSFSLMDLSSIERGFLMPRLTSEERSRLPIGELTAGTLIYNTTLNCIEFYNITRQKWMNMCGDVGPAIFTISDAKCKQIEVSGDYVKGIVLNERKNIITLEVNVSSPGTFDIQALAFNGDNVENGYSFSTKGVFPTAGNFLLILKGNGKPIKGSDDGTPKDIIRFLFNQQLITCTTKNYVKPDFEPLNVEFICNDSKFPITSEGNYKEGESLSSANRIIVPFKVTKPGRGKVFGEIAIGGKQSELIQYESELIDFKTTAVNQVQYIALTPVSNTGKPTVGGKHSVKMKLVTNGRYDYDPFEPKETREIAGCTYEIDVEPLIKNAEMVVYCFNGNQKVFGTYKKGFAMTTANYATINMEVKEPGDYIIKTNNANGIHFELTGTFDTTGMYIEPNALKIYAKGVPLAEGTFTYTFDMPTSVGGTSCSFDVTVEPDALTPKTFLTYSSQNTTYGYGFNGGQANQFITSDNNFGTKMFSTVKMQGGVNLVSKSNNTSNISSDIASTNANVVSVGFNTVFNAQSAADLARFIRNGGGVLAVTDLRNDASTGFLLNAVLGVNPILQNSGGAGTVHPLAYKDDPVLNGPFGDIRGKAWGEDASTTVGIVPSSISSVLSSIEVLSTSSGGNIVAFRHKTLNFVWVGDGGFNSSQINNTSATICPFKVDDNYRPIPKPNYNQPVYNSQFTANALAWLFTQTNK
ncbi:hypothetical protein SAMN04488018_1393 [Myroides marinus]|uniref:Uncharacterized protein n=1 Tax=Myroides marinus TaxID=703342 RepID=A0A1H6YM70_9FLAO|nr:hypothetical protein [Myroides marinus]MDM1354580.1 hypothetical protein [Myroides marinus]SEJ42423.1 hypothetical protein SAMN04488018_1393 [Myroides marinus]